MAAQASESESLAADGLGYHGFDSAFCGVASHSMQRRVDAVLHPASQVRRVDTKRRCLKRSTVRYGTVEYGAAVTGRPGQAEGETTPHASAASREDETNRERDNKQTLRADAADGATSMGWMG